MVLDLKIAFRLVVPYMVLHGIAGRDRTRHGRLDVWAIYCRRFVIEYNII